MSDVNRDANAYDEMRRAIETYVPTEADRETLIAAMENLKAAEETEAFESAYEHLRVSAEAYADRLGPFIASLAGALGA